MEAILKGTVRDFSKKSEIVQTIIIAFLAFVVPTFLAQLINTFFGAGSVIANNSQIIVGTVVNTILVISALNLKGWNKTIFVVTMPSISTIMSGYVFKTASIYMVWMIPAIWLGNFVLILSFKYIMIKRSSSYFIAAIIGIIGKVAIIFGIFMLLKAFNIFPVKMISNLQKAMSLIQLITATLGSLFAFVIYKLENKKEK
jgi:hypothetical protein